jgi:hypothetical protein
MINLAGDPPGLVGSHHRLDEFTELREAPGDAVLGEDGYQGAGFIPFVPPIALKRLQGTGEALGSLSIVAHRLPDHTEALGRPCLESDVIVRGGEVEGPLGQLEGAVRVTFHPGLEQRLVLRREPVDARRQDRLHRRRHVDGLRGLHESVRAALAQKRPIVDEAPHALLEEQGIALGPREKEPLQEIEAGVAPEQRLQQFGRSLRRERVQPELAVVRLPAPAVPVFRPVIEEQQPGRRQALDQAVEHRLRLGVDPVEVLEHDQQWLDLALSARCLGV